MQIGDFDQAKKLFLEGVRLLATNRLDEAETRFTKSLKLLPDRVSTLNNLAVIKLKLRQFAEAEDFARRATVADAQSPEAWANLGMALVGLGRHAEALPACERAFATGSPSAQTWHTKATILSHLEKFEEALPASEAAVQLEPQNAEFLYLKSVIFKKLGKDADSKKAYCQAIEINYSATPVFISRRARTQQASVLVVNNIPEIDDLQRSYADLNLHCPNFPGQFADHLLDDFHFIYVFTGKVTGFPDRAKIPAPDVIINNNTNGQVLLGGGQVAELSAFLDSFGVPVVNHPLQAVQSTRDASVELLQKLPDVIVPKTARFSSENKPLETVVHEIESQFAYPLITRSLTGQHGLNMTKADNHAELAAVIAAGKLGNNFFVTQFVDSRGRENYFRKIRAAVVDQEIVLVRSDYGEDWNIHGRRFAKNIPFYLQNPQVLEEEKRICFQTEATLGRPAVQALRAIRERIPLDVFGIDFNVDAEGRVVFFEANATMNLFSTALKECPNPKEADENLKQAFQRYFISLASQA